MLEIRGTRFAAALVVITAVAACGGASASVLQRLVDLGYYENLGIPTQQ